MKNFPVLSVVVLDLSSSVTTVISVPVFKNKWVHQRDKDPSYQFQIKIKNELHFFLYLRESNLIKIHKFKF